MKDGMWRTKYYHFTNEGLNKAVSTYVEARKRSHNVFFGVCPRDSKNISKFGNEMKATRSNVTESSILWIDSDLKGANVEQVKILQKEKIDELMASRIRPNFIVKSGNGIHAYWKLDEVIDVKTACTFSKRLAVEFSADKAVAEPSRIMRLPGHGLYNRKDPKYPKPVKVVFHDNERIYTLSDFDWLPEFSDEVDIEVEEVQFTDVIIDLSLEQVEKRCKNKKIRSLITMSSEEYERQGNGDNSDSGRDFRVICLLVSSDFDDNEILHVISNYCPWSKFHKDRGNNLKYLARTIMNCNKRVAESREARNASNKKFKQNARITHKGQRIL
ncbi:DNA-primase RepB domain-containing protein [Cohnella abietis]|nr:DNA-primase RepB domain-containing protein [Cohnella abietis]